MKRVKHFLLVSCLFPTLLGAQEMANAIRLVWNNPDLRQKMIEQGLEYVSRFSAEKQASQMMELYRALTKDKKR